MRNLWLVLLLAWPSWAQAGDPLQRLDPDLYGPGTLIAAMEELSTYSPAQAVAELLPLLGHEDIEVARTAAWLLRRMGRGPEGAQAAGTVLADGEASVASRLSAVRALGELRDSTASAALVTALGGNSDEALRVAAARALGQLHRPGAVDALTQALTADESETVRASAAQALGQVPDADGHALLSALQDSSASVRLEAIWSLARPSFAVLAGLDERLIELLQNDQNCRVQAEAAWALSGRGDQKVQAALEAARASNCRLAAQAASWAITTRK